MTKKYLLKLLKDGTLASLVSENVVGETFKGAKEAYNFIKPLVAQTPDVEQTWALFLNAQNKVLAIEKVSQGTLTCSAVYPREIAKLAIEKRAASIILTHNHPSGDVQPSHEDFALTRLLQLTMREIARIIDHIVIGDNKYFSFADHGYIEQYDKDISNFVNNV